MGCRVYVGNLPFTIDESQLRDLFSEGGHVVTSVSVVTDRESGRPRGFAFVEMGSEGAAHKVIADFNGRIVGGRALTVNEAREREDRGGSRSRRY